MEYSVKVCLLCFVLFFPLQDDAWKNEILYSSLASHCSSFPVARFAFLKFTCTQMCALYFQRLQRLQYYSVSEMHKFPHAGACGLSAVPGENDAAENVHVIEKRQQREGSVAYCAVACSIRLLACVYY